MSMDGIVERIEGPPSVGSVSSGRPSTAASPLPKPSMAARMAYADRRLRLAPFMEHKSDRYDDVQTELDPAIFSSLERHLPPNMLGVNRNAKLQFMREILARYLPEGERSRVQKHKEYRQKLISGYQPLNKEIYSLHPSSFFVPSFLKAFNEKTEESFRSILTEISPGVYTFAMLQPRFCQLLLDEVENFEKWVGSVNFKIMRPNTMNKYGAVLDDFGLEAMLHKLIDDFVSPLSKVFFAEVGGSSLDSHHAFVVEYGKDKDIDLGFHVDDSEVTLNVCLGKEFCGGDLFFRGVRCDQHINSETQPEEMLNYSHVPGQAILHRGRHRHGVRATTAGQRINMLLWCRSSLFREMKKYRKDFSSWCGECQREKLEWQRQTVAATKLAFLRSDSGVV